MMQPTQLWDFPDQASVRPLAWPRPWTIHVQRLVWRCQLVACQYVSLAGGYITTSIETPMLRSVRSSLRARCAIVAASLDGRQERAKGGVEVGSAGQGDHTRRETVGPGPVI